MGKGVARRDPTHITLKVKLYMHTMFYVCCSKGLLAKVPILAFFRPDMNKEKGVVIYMYLKHSPDYIDSKFIWVHGLTP